MNPSSERRNYARKDFRCPITLRDATGNVLYHTHTANVSDGGAFLCIPAESLPRMAGEIQVALSLPRSTPNTYMLEDVHCVARIVRQTPMKNADQAGMALQFSKPQKLMLSV